MQNILTNIFSLIPPDRSARKLFMFFELAGIVLGLGLGTLVYLQSKKRGYGKLLWSWRTVAAIVAVFVLSFSYYVLWQQINTPSSFVVYLEAALASAIYLCLTFIVALVAMTAPQGLIKLLKFFGVGGT